MNKGISFLIFAKDVGTDIFGTVNSVIEAAENVNVNYEIVIVDDGSSVPIGIESIKGNAAEKTHLLRIENSVGISGAIVKGLPFCSFEHVLPVPGHNMFSNQAIENVISLAGQGRLVIGCRNNLAAERPLIKKLASRVLRDTYRHLTFYFVGDIHGLILYRRDDLERFLSPSGRHTNAIRVVTPIVVEGGLLLQTIAPITNGHDKRPSRKLRHAFPAPENVVAVIKALFWARRYYKKRVY